MHGMFSLSYVAKLGLKQITLYWAAQKEYNNLFGYFHEHRR